MVAPLAGKQTGSQTPGLSEVVAVEAVLGLVPRLVLAVAVPPVRMVVEELVSTLNDAEVYRDPWDHGLRDTISGTVIEGFSSLHIPTKPLS